MFQRENGNHNLAEVNVAPVVPAKKAKKMPLMDLIRENQEAYIKKDAESYSWSFLR
jgi:hypothetical protein